MRPGKSRPRLLRAARRLSSYHSNSIEQCGYHGGGFASPTPSAPSHLQSRNLTAGASKPRFRAKSEAHVIRKTLDALILRQRASQARVIAAGLADDYIDRHITPARRLVRAGNDAEINAEIY